jgi:hypothetical protein
MKCVKKYSNGGKTPKPPKKDVGKLLERLSKYQGRVSGLLAGLEDMEGPKPKGESSWLYKGDPKYFRRIR